MYENYIDQPPQTYKQHKYVCKNVLCIITIMMVMNRFFLKMYLEEMYEN